MNPDCQHVREMMDSYLSEELSVETNHGVLRHLGECRDCAAELKRRQRLRALLSQTLDVAVDADRVSARITQAVDREQRSWGRVARLAGVAATLVAAVAVAYWAGRPVDAAAYDDSAEDHIACALAYPEGATYDRIARRRISPHPSSASSMPSACRTASYHVIDAHMCPYKGRNYAHVVIRGNTDRRCRSSPSAPSAGRCPPLPRPCLPETRSTFMPRHDWGMGFRRWRRATTGSFSSLNGRPTRPTSRRTSSARRCASFAVSRSKLTSARHARPGYTLSNGVASGKIAPYLSA